MGPGLPGLTGVLLDWCVRVVRAADASRVTVEWYAFEAGAVPRRLDLLFLVANAATTRREMQGMLDQFARRAVHWNAAFVVGAADAGRVEGETTRVLHHLSPDISMQALARLLFETAGNDGRLRGLDPCALLGHAAGAVDPRVRGALDHMARHIDQHLSIDATARASGVSPRQLHRRFVQSLGGAPLAILRRLRVEFGRHLLEREDVSITEVACRCGFADGPHFARSFARVYGRTPVEYRRSLPRHAREAASVPQVRWTLAGVDNHTYKTVAPLREFARRVRARSKDRIQISVVTHRDLGLRPAQLVDAVRQGAADACVLFPETLVDVPEFLGLLPQGVLAAPQRNERIRDVQRALIDDAVGAMSFGVVSEFADYEFQRFWLFSREPVETLAQMRRLRVAHWSAIGQAGLRDLGIMGVQLHYRDIRRALADGEVDAVVGLPRFASSLRLGDLAPFGTPAMAVTRHYPNTIVMRRDRLATLPAALIEAVRAVGQEMSLESDAEWRAGLEDRESLAVLSAAGMRELDALSLPDLEKLEDSMLARWRKTCEYSGAFARDACASLHRALLA